MNVVQYNGEHSVIFDGVHSWYDWGLVPSSRVIIPLPEMNKSEVEVPGRSGSVDLSTFMSGHSTYKNRTGSMGFYATSDSITGQDLMEDMLAHMLGKKIKVELEDEPGYYYYGYCVPSYGDSEKGAGVVGIQYAFDPFKRSLYLDSAFSNIALNGSKNLTVKGSIAYDSPVVTTTNQITVSYRQNVFTIPSGTHTIYGMQLGPGTHTITLNGASTVTFDFRGGVI